MTTSQAAIGTRSGSIKLITGKLVTAPITSAVRQILWPLRGHHPEFVFTYVTARTLKGRGLVNGERRPITHYGAKTARRRLRADAGVESFRFHDFRHNVGTKLLRETGNLKLVLERLGSKGRVESQSRRQTANRDAA